MGVCGITRGALNMEYVWNPEGFKSVGFRCVQRILRAINLQSDWL